jgi:hypothetical protein
LLEGSQASTPRHSDKTRVKVKMLKWYEAVALDRGPRSLIFGINVKGYNL